MMVSRLFLMTCALTCGLGLAGCSSESANVPKLPPAERYRAMVEDFDTKNADLLAQLDQAQQKRDLASVNELRDSIVRLRAESTKLAMSVAAETDDDDLAARALTWVAKHNQRNQWAAKALEIIRAQHLDSPLIGDALSDFVDVETLESLVEYSPHPDIKTIAKYFLATRQHNQDVAEELLTNIERESPDVVYRGKAMAEIVKSPLKHLRYLRVGKTAMDIVAEDIDGKEFKLSDYRGKVVMLDFWADW